MTLNPQQQEAIVEERGKELFRDHIGQFSLFASLKPKNVLTTGGQILFTTLNTSTVKV